MPLSVFFQPVSLKQLTPDEGFATVQIGSVIDTYVSDFPELNGENKPDLALFGVEDDRKSIGNEGCASAANAVRKQLYSLYTGENPLKLADLGNIAAGDTVNDTYVAVKKVCEELMKEGIIPIIIGGGQDLTYAQYTAYEALEQKVEVAVVDPRFDLDQHNTENAPLHSQTYLNHIILHEPDYLFNVNCMGFQRYFVSRQSEDLFEKLYFNATRLGEVAGRIEQVEPLVRSADMLSFDMAAIRFSDAPGNANVTPNGLFGQEACQLARYAGMSDKLSSIGFYEYNPSLDIRRQTATLLAQMIWYFIDGFYCRKSDMPFIPQSAYITYRATLEHEGHELVFVKSKKTDRWWMQVPYFGSRSVNERYYLVPCRYEDYQIAVSGEMPDLWWRTHQKLQ
jgi:formiminoglutamase